MTTHGYILGVSAYFHDSAAALVQGDRIVAAGVDRLQEGQRVRAWVREGGL